MKICILDYGMGNVKSVANMLKTLDQDVAISNNPEIVNDSELLILPGVGSFDKGITSIEHRSLDTAIYEHVNAKHKPILGICLGMQLLGEASREGKLKGLGLIPFHCERFEFSSKADLKVPHVGWDFVELAPRYKLGSAIRVDKDRFYFTHSYYAICDNPDNEWMSCRYGIRFTAAVRQEKVFGVQFHPEKSHRFGMDFFKRFLIEIH